MLTVFNRYEKKYLISREVKEKLIKELIKYLAFDNYSQNGNHYNIHSIYFDSSDYRSIRESVSKPVYKEKLRFRSYNFPFEENDNVFLEIKKKFKGKVNKRRIYMSYKAYLDYIEQKITPEFSDIKETQIFKEIDYMINSQSLNPAALISYDRVALYDEKSSLRITFDTNIVYSNDKKKYDLLESENLTIMEIKTHDNFPLWLTNILSDNQIYSSSYSKYGTAFEIIKKGGTTCH